MDTEAPAPLRRCEFKGCREPAAARVSGRGRPPKYCPAHKAEAKREQDRQPRGTSQPPPECCLMWRQSPPGKASRYKACRQHRQSQKAEKDLRWRYYSRFTSSSDEKDILLRAFGPAGGFRIEAEGNPPKDDTGTWEGRTAFSWTDPNKEVFNADPFTDAEAATWYLDHPGWFLPSRINTANSEGVSEYA